MCGPDGAALKSAAHPVGKPSRRSEPSPKALRKLAVEVVPQDAIVVRVSRKDYLKLKARERRKRERAAADKAGITVAAWRKREATMPSYEYFIGERDQVGSRFVARANEEIQRALVTEKASRKITQQSIADKLDVHRSVINRRFMGLENMTLRSVAELLWAIGWEPYFEARKVPTDGH